MYNDSAQVINSDGSNNLKVFVVNESGGGGGGGGIVPAVLSDPGAYINFTISGAVTSIATLSASPYDYIYGATLGIHVTGSGLAVAQYEIAQLVIEGPSLWIRLINIPIWFDPGVPTPAYFEREIWYPVPINISESLGAVSTACHIKVFSGTWADHCTVSVTVGNAQT